METIEPTVTIDITEDMSGDMFETREGKIVRLESWWFSSLFSDGISRTPSDPAFELHHPYPQDIVKHLPKSKYPEYYL